MYGVPTYQLLTTTLGGTEKLSKDSRSYSRIPGTWKIRTLTLEPPLLVTKLCGVRGKDQMQSSYNDPSVKEDGI